MSTTTEAPAMPAEVVTHSPVQDVALPGGAGTLALVTLDNGHDHTRPNTFGPESVAGDGSYGRWVLNRDTGEYSVVGSYQGVLDDEACAALTE